MASPPDTIRTFTVAQDDDGIRLDRWFKRHLPEISFNIVSRWARTGLLRIDDKRVATGQVLRVPPAEAEARGEPELAVLVVRQSDRLPGQGWWVAGGGSAHGYDGAWEGAEAAAYVARLQQKAFDYWHEQHSSSRA